MLRRIVLDPRNLPFVLSVILALMLVPEIPSPAVRPTSGWRGWYVLLYREAAAPAVEAALQAAAPGSVSRATAIVRIDVFSEIETLRVAALEARLDPLDSRMDAWLSGVPRYFQAWDGGRRLVAAYVPATRGRIAAWLRFARTFDADGVPRGSWQLLELEPLARISVPVAALGFALAVAWCLRRETRRGLLLAAAGIFAWLPGLLNGGPSDLCFVCTALYFWMPRAADGVRHAHGRRSSPQSGRAGMRIGVLLGVAVAVIATGDAAVYRATRMGASMLCLELLAELAWPLLQLRSPLRQGRGRFEPVPILAPPRRTVFAPLAAALAAGLLVTVPAGLSRLQVPLPRQVSLAGAGSRTGIEAAVRARDAGRLPGLAEAVGHAASLQTIAFGAAEGTSPLLPAREERVRLREYADGSGGSLIEAPRTVVRFDPGWLDLAVAGFRSGTVERLLIEQRRAVEVRFRAPWAALLQAVPAALACLALLGAPLVGPAARRLLMRLGLWAITEPARRRRTR
ncbi:MAG: hypothetical protein NTU62_02220 [Spirochaetes bacterium]|nr:hypothetical protein [Spirochaetota bacterium]